MPIAPPKACSRCRRAHAAGACQVKRPDTHRQGNFRERGYSARWDRAAAAFRKLHPLCAECVRLGIDPPALAQCVDHIIPPQLGAPDWYEKFWSEANWQSLCGRHHSAKTSREDGGFGNGAK